jgi:iron(III) transport system substrate-binding protein
MQLVDADKPEWLTKLDIKEMKMDWNVMGQKEGEWISYWSKNIKGKGGN